ncbi:hypothetical protein PGB90_002548 [Kerria lacca]
MTSKGKRKEQSIIHKLRNREVLGTFDKNVTAPNNKAKLLFGDIPPRLRFHLKSVIEDMGNHILMGMTQCGQFMLTYTFTMDHAQTNNRFIYGSSCFKYQLHWWRFKIGAAAVLVAEVHLFENQDIHDVLTIGIAQWPSVGNKILVYGQSCTTPQVADASEFRKIYITITMMPSLNNCKDCINVKRSIQEDISDNWDSSISSHCLRHGLTVHTMFSVFPPYPAINLSFALKDENRIIVNTGNSLHVLFIDLEENNHASVYYENIKSVDDTIVNDELHHRLGPSLAMKGYDYKVPVINNFSDGTSEQLLSNKSKRLMSRAKNNKFKSCLQNSDCDNQCENCKSDCDDCHVIRSSKRSKCTSVPIAITKEAWLRQLANKIYDFAESDDSCNLKFKWYRRRTIADKMYEFCSEDEDTENIHPLSFHFGTTNPLSMFRSSSSLYKEFNNGNVRKPCDIDLEDGDQISVTSQNSDCSDFAESHLSVTSPVTRCNFDSSNALNRDKYWIYDDNESPSQLNVTCDSVWLDWESTSLSPRSDISHSTTTSGECSELKIDSARSFLENLPTMGSAESYSPKYVSPIAVKCYPGCTNNKDRSKTKDTPILKKFFCRESNLKSVLKLHNCNLKFTGCTKDTKKNMTNVTNLKKSNKEMVQHRYLVPYTSARFEKRFIEMDEEILSTVTDIDDEDGCNYALPLSVHGTGYTQMQVVANNKVDKLNVPCCVVRQDSLDIEQFSYKMAVIICKCQGYKFWFCNDYDIEIVDVCPLNGEIMAVVFLRINADPPINKSSLPQDQGPAKEPRQFFETRCLFVWNARSRCCWLEAYTPLVEDPPLLSLNNNGSVHKNPARTEAEKLRLLRLGFFNIPLIRPIRYFQHLVLDNIKFGPSLEIIEDEFNMISFYKEREEIGLGLADDSMDEISTISDYSSEQTLSDDDDDLNIV